MIKTTVLGSGSKGNSVYCEVDGAPFLIDAGLNYKQTCQRLSLINRDISSIKYVFISHEHNDHTQALKQIQKKHTGVQVFMPEDEAPVFPAQLHAQRFELVHDVPCVGYSFSDSAGNKLVYVTDTGEIPDEAIPAMYGCNIAIIEFNHDVDCLIDSKYATELQERVFETHLRNEQSRELLEAIATERLSHVIAYHISNNSNRHELVKYEAKRGVSKGRGKSLCELQRQGQVILASQGTPTKMVVVV